MVCVSVSMSGVCVCGECEYEWCVWGVVVCVCVCV